MTKCIIKNGNIVAKTTSMASILRSNLDLSKHHFSEGAESFPSSRAASTQDSAHVKYTSGNLLSYLRTLDLEVSFSRRRMGCLKHDKPIGQSELCISYGAAIGGLA